MINVPQFRIKTIRLVILTGLLATFPLVQNCSGVGFTKSTDSSAGAAGGGGGDATGNLNQNSCNNTQLQTSTTPIKILLVVDTSGSNEDGYDINNVFHYGTDNYKVMRGNSIQSFFSDYGVKPNFNWGFITFHGSTATAILNTLHDGTKPAFTSKASDMQAAITYFRSPAVVDTSLTPYKAAIQMAHDAILNDPADSATTKYIVVFLSDGLPTDYDDSAAGDTQISSDVTSLLNIKAGRISFNTVYYGPKDDNASGRLHMMATSGHGQFLDTNANPAAKDFLINNVVTVPGTTCAGN